MINAKEASFRSEILLVIAKRRVKYGISKEQDKRTEPHSIL